MSDIPSYVILYYEANDIQLSTSLEVCTVRHANQRRKMKAKVGGELEMP